MRNQGGRGGAPVEGRSASSGPALPFKLRQELEISPAAGGSRGPRQRGSMFRVSQRKEQRKAARHNKGRGSGSSLQHGRGRGPGAGQRPEQAAEAKESKHNATKITAAPMPAQKRMAAAPAERPASSKRTRFHELLNADVIKAATPEAMAAEAALQRQLAKKLGIKGKKAKATAPLPAPADDPDGSESSDSSDGEDDDEEDLLPGSSASEGSEEDAEDGEDSSGVDSQDTLQSGSSGVESMGSEGEGEDLEEERRALSKEAGPTGRAGAAAPVGKYVPPAARGRSAGGDEAGALRKRVKGLLNRLTEATLQSSVGQAGELLQAHSRGSVVRALTEELLQAVAHGPRATDRFAAVSAGFVVGLAASLQAQEVGAHFLDALALRLEAAVAQQDSLAGGNLAAVVAHLYGLRLLEATTLFSLLAHLRERFSEHDVALIHALLHAVGFQLRSDDPAAMKDFVTAVHARAGQASGAGQLSSRAEVLLSLVLDIKNNRQRSNKGAAAVSVSSVLSSGVLKWLRGPGLEEAALRSLPWAKLLQPGKKGLWWLPSAAEAEHLAPLPGTSRALAAAAAADGGGNEGGAELLALAGAQRMSTEARRAVFCAVMGAGDCADARERLLRLPLKGQSEREVVRVTLECALAEKGWNPYYAHLLAQLAAAAKGHRVTLQYCLWDQFKQVPESDVRRLANLARLTAALIAGKTLPVTILKVVDFTEALSAKQLLFWRAMLEELLRACTDPAAANATFARFAGQPALATARAALTVFLRRSFGPWLAARSGNDDGMLLKLQAAEAGLAGARS